MIVATVVIEITYQKNNTAESDHFLNQGVRQTEF